MREIQSFKSATATIDYVIDYPQKFDKSKKYPILFYMHGYGYVNKDISFLAENYPVRRERHPENSEFIIVAPKCNNQTWISIFESLCSFLDSIVANDFIDKNRVYLSGSSMGGYTAWILLQVKRTFFAAAVICCGGGQYWAASSKTFNNIPIKAVHGKLDDIVLCRESEIMAEKINANGGNCELIIYDDLGHDVWTRTFSDKQTYNWFLENARKK